MNIHQSVLLNEMLYYFEECKIRAIVDGTLGAGGHSEALLREHPEIEILIGIDQDPDALQIARERLNPWKEKIVFAQGNFSRLGTVLLENRVSEVDAVILDLGVSSMQLDRAEKGFSFQKEGPLDMRMDPLQSLTAKEIVNSWSERELGRIFRDFGEEKQWRAAARAIIRAREQKEIDTTEELTKILYPVLYKGHKKTIHPLTLVFQALRISVNRELDSLEKALPQALACLRPGGRMGIISFHSLEDRIVKNFFRYQAADKEESMGWGDIYIPKESKLKILTKKPVEASSLEIQNNPRSRSAKLRVAEKL
jgi:16S rRNA (cytosine1402-N4)-methyltransferase